MSIGQAQVDNLLPDDRYRTILTSNAQPHHTMIRVYCKEGESVGGIAVKEHLGKLKFDLNKIENLCLRNKCCSIGDSNDSSFFSNVNGISFS